MKDSGSMIRPPSSIHRDNPAVGSGAFITPTTTIQRDNPTVGSRAFNSPPSTIQRDNPAVDTFEVSFITVSPSNSSAKTKSSGFDVIPKTTSHWNEEVYDWTSGNDEELRRALPRNLISPPSIPRKARKTDVFSTPGERSTGSEANPYREEDVYNTPTTATPTAPGLFSNYNLPSPGHTPVPPRFGNSTSQDPDLATQLLQVFDRKKIPLSRDVRDEVRAIAKKHDMNFRGMVKGRDLSREAIAKKSEEIVKLQETIIALEAQEQLLREFVGR